MTTLVIIAEGALAHRCLTTVLAWGSGRRDPFIEHLEPILDRKHHGWSYEELDPDVFGEELDRPVYTRIDRIAAVGLSVRHQAA